MINKRKGGVLSKLVLISIISQILSFISNPILASYFSPDELGMFRYYLNLSSLLTIFCGLGFERAIYKANEKEKKELMFLGGSFCFIFCVGLVFFSIYIGNAFLVLSSVYVILSLSYVYVTSYFSSGHDFRRLYYIKLTQGLTSPLLKVSSASLGLSVIYLI
ncbi:oligosaccharide flippase family protein, partial [Vibrio sp. FNV 38]|nr:oligosaccharide flippase family protein [Vibrio sp. FNV 38]